MNTHFIKNALLSSDQYKSHSEAVVISCFFNPQNSPYRTIAFNRFYESIKHLNHRIIECVIGNSEPQLEETEYVTRVHTENLLWHKEALLNKIIAELPSHLKYIFWVDADVIFENKNWMLDSVHVLQTKAIMQPFEYCVHMEQDEQYPTFDLVEAKKLINEPMNPKTRRIWRSFCANHETTSFSSDTNYDKHGHVGFAWGAQRWLLEECPLYDRALIGGADHIIAHAAAGHIPHSCITKSFTDDIEAVEKWMRKFYLYAQGSIGYVSGDLYHIWHGDIQKRQYLKRIQDFTPVTKSITERDSNGLFVTNLVDDSYMTNYFQSREVSEPAVVVEQKEFEGFGGGSSGGAGAGGSWDDVPKDNAASDDTKQDNQSTDDSQNFS